MGINDRLESALLNSEQTVNRVFLNGDQFHQLKPGDIIGVKRFYVICPFVHYGVYAGDGKVIHYAPKDWNGDDSFACLDAKSCKAALKRAWEYEYNITSSDIPENVIGILNKLKRIADVISENVANAQECSVHEAPFSEFLGQFMGKATEKFFVLRAEDENSESVGTGDVFSAEKTLMRARQRIGEASYRLTSNNCEHFAMWCRTGVSTSHQADTIEHLLMTCIAKPAGKVCGLWQVIRDSIVPDLGTEDISLNKNI